jgi:hypothetical protein
METSGKLRVPTNWIAWGIDSNAHFMEGWMLAGAHLDAVSENSPSPLELKARHIFHNKSLS